MILPLPSSQIKMKMKTTTMRIPTMTLPPSSLSLAEDLPKDLVHSLEKLTAQRREKLFALLANRSEFFVPIMENIYDQGNVNAVIRSSESFGFFQLGQVASIQSKKSSRVTSGADKWVEITRFSTIEQAISLYRKKGYTIGATTLSSSSTPLEAIDFSSPTALVFGNEKEGCSPTAQKLSDFHCKIATVGFTQSFNISVAAAISLYHVHSFLKKSGQDYLLCPERQKKLLAKYLSTSP